MTKYLFDTNIVSYFTSGKYPELNAKILATSPNQRYINWVVQQEILYVVFRKNRLDLEVKYKKFFNVCNIIQSSSEIVEICARLESDLDNEGCVVGLEDIWIASACLVHDMTLITNNTKHFSQISGLKLENWVR